MSIGVCWRELKWALGRYVLRRCVEQRQSSKSEKMSAQTRFQCHVMKNQRIAPTSAQIFITWCPEKYSWRCTHEQNALITPRLNLTVSGVDSFVQDARRHCESGIHLFACCGIKMPSRQARNVASTCGCTPSQREQAAVKAANQADNEHRQSISDRLPRYVTNPGSAEKIVSLQNELSQAAHCPKLPDNYTWVTDEVLQNYTHLFKFRAEPRELSRVQLQNHWSVHPRKSKANRHAASEQLTEIGKKWRAVYSLEEYLSPCKPKSSWVSLLGSMRIAFYDYHVAL